MDSERRLIDGDEVTFTVGFPGQAMAVPWDFEAGGTEPQKPFLGATASHDGKRVWSGAISDRIDSRRPIRDQFSDPELEALYRQARARSP
jgi:hypothetical protein